ncbi:MAG TPA: HEAT repeat domain-containing protein [Verrucomicrobiae bacterium]|nr:HEAT repeat domain-containing protein [Verrucomicrobiae bacterium]
MQWLTLRQLKSKNARIRKSAVEKLGESGDIAAIEPLTSCLLRDDEASVRCAAAHALGEFKDDRALTPLVMALSDDAPVVREVVISSLKKLGDLRAINSLVAALRDPNEQVRYRAAQALQILGWQPQSDDTGTTFFVALGQLEQAARMGSAAVEPLLVLLKDGAYQKRVAAVELLSQINDSRVVKPLVEALKDADSLVRTAAANALSRAGDARAVDPLLSVLNDADHNARAAAASALSKLGDDRVIGPLVKTLKDHHWEVRAAALEALGQLRDRSSVEAVIALLRDPDKEVRQNAAEALGNLGDDRAVEALVLTLKDEQSAVRQAAARALRRVEPYWERSEAARRALPEIRAALRDKDYAVQVAAAEILKALGEAPMIERQLATVMDGTRHKRHTAADVLLSLLEDYDPDLRQAAAESLGRIGDPRAVEPLVRTLDDASPWVRKSAAKSLESLRWQPADAAQRARQLVVQEKWDDAVAFGEMAVPPLVTSLSSGDSQTRLAAVGALAQLRDPSSADAIAALLRDKHGPVRQAAAEALKQLGAELSDPDLSALAAIALRDWQAAADQGAAAVEPLIALLVERNDEPEIIEAAGQTLSFISDPGVAELLLAHVQDGRVSAAVATALEQALQQNPSEIPASALQQIAVLPNPQQFTYQREAGQGTYRRVGDAEVECSALRQLAEEELRRRDAEPRDGDGAIAR